MTWIRAAIIGIGCVALSTTSSAQGGSALPFLLISPYAEANGMGEASVASLTDNPLALMTNPAHLGMQSQRNYFSFGYNHADWLPQFHQPDLWVQSYAFTAGINLKKTLDIEPELSLGLAYSRVYLNLGEFTVTGNDPTPISTFAGFEKSDQYSLGVGINYWVNASAGVTFKHVFSNLALVGFQTQAEMVEASVNAYDFGLLLNIPIVGIISRLREEPVKLLPFTSPFLDFNIGYAKNNLGDEEVIYSGGPQADPLPRYARVGIGFDIGLRYSKNNVEWNPLSFKWTIEANDLLVHYYPAVRDVSGNVVRNGGWEYQGGLGDINFFDEVILGHTNPQTIKKKGWELNLLKIFSIRGGRFEEDPDHGNRRFNTTGYGVQLEGLVKFLRVIDVPFATGDVFDFIANHMNVRYDHSEIITDDVSSALSGTKFNSINLFISN